MMNKKLLKNIFKKPWVYWVGAPVCDLNSEIQTDFTCIKIGNPSDFTSKIYSIGLGFIGGLALLFIIWGGYLILSSQGDADKLQKGKSYIISSVIGLVLAFSGFAIYQIITVDVLKIFK